MSEPTFSVIVPANDDQMATARTLSNLVHQTGKKVPLEILLVSDGPAKWCRNVARTAQTAAKNEDRPVKVRYLWTPQHMGTGNFGRALGLEEATNDWVFFIDSGTAVLAHALSMLDFALQDKPESDMIVWDIIQMVDPCPFIWFSGYLKTCLELEKIGYWVPGVGAAIRREIGQKIVWPNFKTSDWAYWSAVWQLLEKPVKLAAIQHPLVIAYAAYDYKRFRALTGPLAWDQKDFNKSFEDTPYAEPIPSVPSSTSGSGGTSS